MNVIVKGGELGERERQAYVDHITKRYGDRIDTLNIKLDGDFVDLSYTFKPQPFDRIRRITGYLVGTMDRWNNAKTHEEADRVKHGI